MAAGVPAPERGTGREGNGREGDAARARLADQLRDSERAGADVEAAFRAVPRHLFLPEMTPARAYQDEAFAIKYGAGGLPLSSSSQPAIMAIMLEQLGLKPGHRVLEIGAGTGYNAALIAHILGDQEAVVTVDIDEQIAGRARASLAAAGYGAVKVICADGALGVAEHAPYDRIIVTVGAWDIAPQWLEQLAPGGRIVLPLSVRGIQLSVALERSGDHWASRSAWRCGFIRLAGSLAGPESYVPLGPQPGLHVYADDGRPLDTGALYAALSGDVTDVPTDLGAADTGELGDLDLWLTITEPSLIRLTLAGVQSRRARHAPLMPLGGLARTSGTAAEVGIVAVVPARAPRPSVLREAAGPREQAAALAAMVRGFGPGGAGLARYLAHQALAWHQLGRPGAADLRLQAYPAEAEPGAGRRAGRPAVPAVPAGAAGGKVILERRHVRLELGWPSA